MRQTRALARMIAAAALSMTPVLAHAAFSCPSAEPVEDTLPDLQSVDVTAADPTVSKPILASIDHLRTAGLPSGRIVDRLVAAYRGKLGTVAGLSDDAKAERVRRFASTVSTFVYDRSSKPQEEDILVDVPVPLSVFHAMTAAVTKAGTTQDAWVNGAIQRRLGQP